MSRLFRTTPTPLPTLARVAVGLILFPHGAQHVLGWFGGYGFHGTLGWMTGTLGFPAVLAVLALVTEITAPVALILGLGGRIAAIGVIGLMLGAISTHVANGFFMNWFGALPAGSEGFEYHLLVIALAGVVVLGGSGAWSLDQLLGRERPIAAVTRAIRAAA
ncbi:MAG TPA: DoxX family protein [Gemmatimonadales bacterium]|nr:DoxX family protein [Gemmatimonadales bacterium]